MRICTLWPTIRRHHRPHHLALRIPLPDAARVTDQLGDQWYFSDNEGHSDWVVCPEYLPSMHARYADALWYTVQRYPGMTAEDLDDARYQWAVETDPRQHPSLSAAERNA